jgi:hypothetical protein
MTDVIHVADADYLVASQCHPSVFHRLAGKNVRVWHAFTPGVKERLRERGIVDEPLIYGGSAAVTRAIAVAHVGGYRDIHIHGADSSYRGDERHAQPTRFDGKITRIDIHCGGREFVTTPPLAVQAQDFPWIVEFLSDVKFTVHGDGLIPHIARMMGVHAMNTKET